MSLKDLVVPTETVEVYGQPVVLRGLTPADITRLLSSHRADLDALVEEFNGKSGALDANAETMVMEFLQKMPALAAKVIAHAAGEPDEYEKVAALPFPVQIDMLMAVGRLTFEGPGSVKKFLDNVLSLMLATRTTLSDLNGSVTSTRNVTESIGTLNSESR